MAPWRAHDRRQLPPAEPNTASGRAVTPTQLPERSRDGRGVCLANGIPAVGVPPRRGGRTTVPPATPPHRSPRRLSLIFDSLVSFLRVEMRFSRGFLGVGPWAGKT